MIDLRAVSLQTRAVMLMPLTVLVLLSVGAMFIVAAGRVRHLLSSQRAQQHLFRGAAMIMVVAAASMLRR